MNSDADTRVDICHAVRQVFACRSVDLISVREVAETDKVSHAVIYYCFKDKVDLYHALLGDSFDELDWTWDHKISLSNTPVRRKI